MSHKSSQNAAAPLSNELDMSAYWMPFTANRQFKANPRVIVEAQGMHYTAMDGRKVLDGVAGLWCVNAGHGRREIAEAVERQLLTMDYATAFQIGHPGAFELAARIARIAPVGLDRVFFANSGSEAVESALKIALAYHHARGQAQRTRFVGREKGYHGCNFGGMSVGGLVNNRRAFGALLPYVDYLPHTLDTKRNAFTKGQPEHGAELADALEGIIALHGADTIAGVIVEPMSGSAGVILPPKGYLERLRAICDRHGLLLIFDEVITGFGRMGAAFASQALGVVPDIFTVAKGITNGAIPMGAAIAKREIHDAIMQGPEHVIELFHGYTYSGHPVACAAGLATLDIYEGEGLFERAAALAPVWEEAVHTLKGEPHVADIRNTGIVAGIELEPRADGAGKRAFEVYQDCFANGVLVRQGGEIIALSPPLIVTESQIGEIVDALRNALRRVA
ncbi:aspartate aminotransferase family protein [Rhodomicrobium vannielii ATCC 17100]|uniref:aspartate aminotransferase family protein n=1 Tax=Rhodomicrobium vannielii TaxID=1069 RepID=UPI00191A5A15|nr:aspartate aminotransferase family protein [Rhodomicrobium vannielii]MBJ7535613.1 aspartate aminotransferase family protein [Rhodomicrobium vannielii ATCC 17100]